MKSPFFLASDRVRLRREAAQPASEPADGAEARAAPAPDAPPPGTIGAILVAAGRLSLEDARRVVATQEETDSPFGETAVRLGVVSDADVKFALSRQFAMPCMPAGSQAVDAEVIAAFHPDHELVERMRNLRGQIAVRALDRKPPFQSIAILSAERGAGRTYVAANLATVFAQLGARTLLVDADLVHPRLHQLFRLSNRNGLSTILAGRGNLKAVTPIEGLPGLAVLPSGPLPPNPDDLIARPTLAQLLRRLESDFDVILIDTPAWTAGSSARMVASAARAAVQLVQAGQTDAMQASEMAHEIAHVGANLLGAVMNRPA